MIQWVYDKERGTVNMTIKEYNINDLDFSNTELAYHINKRTDRLAICQEIGLGTFINCFSVDKGHYNGSELHCVTSTGLTFIFNQKSMKFITVLVTKRGQLKRYYDSCGLVAPPYLLEIARQHIADKLNEVK